MTRIKTRKSLQQTSRTKTVATVGPACDSPEMLAELIECGVNVFRLNMAHGTRTDHESAIAKIREASNSIEIPVAILIDLAGPKIRLGELATEPLEIKNGQKITFVRGTKSTSRDQLTCNYEPLIDELKTGDAIVLADGIARLEVIEKLSDQAVCRVIDGGAIRSRQGVNLPGTQLSVAALGEQDRENAIWAAAQDIDFISLSFVRNANEIKNLKQLLSDHGSQVPVVAKIEKQEALKNLNSIVEVADCVMVARGDLGVEIPIEKTPLAQKQIIRACSHYRKPVIVATQMLESMHNSKQPTRAEVNDVANAILDGADACMLSGETAIGQYPRESVNMMQRIMLETEENLKQRGGPDQRIDQMSCNDVSESVIYGAAQIAKRLEARIVVIASSTGEAPRLKSKQRDYIKTICITDNIRVLNQMCLYWSIVPVYIPSLLDHQKMRTFVNVWAKVIGQAKPGDPMVLVTDTEWLPDVHDTVVVCRVT